MTTTNDVTTPAASPRRAKWIAAASWAYLAAAMAAWATLRVAGERWWPATLLLFGPRWVLVLPIALLAPAILWVRRPRLLAVLALAAAVVAGPVMGLCVPWRRALGGGGGPHLRVLTCNIHGKMLNRQAMEQLIATAQPDVVALQEWPSGEAPGAPMGGIGWHVLGDGELRLESRYPIRKVYQVLDFDESRGQAVRYAIDLPGGAVPFVNVHLASPHGAFSAAVRLEAEGKDLVEDNIEARRHQALSLSLDAQRAGDTVILAGDFNLPCDSEIFRDALLGFGDAFSQGGFGYGWTYRQRGTRVRIDHVLSGGAWRCRRSWVGPDVGAPHLPLIADLERNAK